MTNATQQRIVLKTDEGEFVYPWLNKPDTKFNAEGLYHIKVKLAAHDARPLIETLKHLRDDAVRAEQAKTGRRTKLQELPFEESIDGNHYTFKFKLNAKGVNRKTQQPFEQKPLVYGPDGAPTDALVTNGSRGLVAFEPVVFANAALGVGLTLRLKAVKVTSFAAMANSGGTTIFGDARVANAVVSQAMTGGDDAESDGAYDFA